jgi:DNA-binding MarR family transcriptional regulator
MLRHGLASARQRTVLAQMLGLSESDVLAVQYLSRAGRLTPGQLSDRLGLTSGGVTALVQRLERHGYIVRRPHPTDRRSTLLALTPAIADRAAETLSPLIEEIDRAAEDLTDAQREVVGQTREVMAQAAERHVEHLLQRVRAGVETDHGVATPEVWA